MDDERRVIIVRFADPGGKHVKLPEGFVEEWGEEVGEEVIFTHADGKDFRIRLVARRNSLWLGHGWSKFKEYTHLNYRDTLCLKYNFDNRFDSLVFDLSGVENKSRSLVNNRRPIHFLKKVERRSFASKLILPDNFTKLCSGLMRNPINLVHYDDTDKAEYEVDWKMNPQPEYITLTNGWDKFVNDFEIRKNEVLLFTFNYTDELVVEVVRHDAGVITEVFSGKDVETAADGNTNVESFTITLTEGSSNPRQGLYLPAPIAKTYFMHEPANIRVKLPTGEREHWTIINGVERKETKIGKGWYGFAETNKLEAGDSVSFIKKGRDSFELKIVSMDG